MCVQHRASTPYALAEGFINVPREDPMPSNYQTPQISFTYGRGCMDGGLQIVRSHFKIFKNPYDFNIMQCNAHPL